MTMYKTIEVVQIKIEENTFLYQGRNIWKSVRMREHSLYRKQEEINVAEA